MDPVRTNVDECSQISAKVNGNSVTFWVDTAATLLSFEFPQVSDKTVITWGAAREEIKYLSTPLPIVLNDNLMWEDP